ncbi:hypothetical protein IH768_29710, partial [Escherichia coli]|nr:hypothetical protein [Escherichia coli]
ILALAGDIACTKGGHGMAVNLKGDELFRAQRWLMQISQADGRSGYQ